MSEPNPNPILILRREFYEALLERNGFTRLDYLSILQSMDLDGRDLIDVETELRSRANPICDEIVNQIETGGRVHKRLANLYLSRERRKVHDG